MIKKSGVMPKGWNRGLVTLVHKKGPREDLSNYRPLTVIISLCGLYSKILNERLEEAVEHHKLLGEIQNGFRKDRGSNDNSYILDTLLWKARAKGYKVHMGFIDLHKASYLSFVLFFMDNLCGKWVRVNYTLLSVKLFPSQFDFGYICILT